MNSSIPGARRSDLVLQEMDGETLVYDTLNAQTNLLNRTAGVIWQECDGTSSAAQIAARAARVLNTPVDEALVWYTVGQLSSKNLLQQRAALPANLKGMTRRDFLRAGLVGTAVMLPVVISMTAPNVSHAASCIASGQPCIPTAGPQCCQGPCTVGTCP